MSTKPSFDLLAIGNALVDVLSPCKEEFIVEQGVAWGMKRGAMNLVDSTRALALYNAMGPATEMSGGSAANTMASFASLGGKGAYIGKVGKDQLGDVFAHDIRALGVEYATPRLATGTPTGRCMVLITPDGERTMNTFLGAAVELTPEDVDEERVNAAAITYLEGYLFDPPHAMEAFYKAAEIAHKAGRKVALTLSDPFCVNRHRAAFQDLVEGHVDILFANEDEAMALYELSEFDQAVRALSHRCEITAITRSELGSLILADNDVWEIPAKPVQRAVDTTGAGDAYAAGVLFGLTQGRSLAECGRIGAIAASEVISHMGPRPMAPLNKLMMG